MPPPQQPHQPAVLPNRSAPGSYRMVYVLAGLAALCWAFAALSAAMMVDARDLPEGTVTLIAFLWLVGFEMLALLLQLIAAWELRRRNSPFAALFTLLVAVAGVVATFVFLDRSGS
ncbi:hypothetical protein ACN263_30445 [Micromonospora sp. WMMD729]|uniref:hypothetical protein n=1 Tax=Micromonospora sp. WMMD729 TaxID=3404127 RepID=UPI003BF5D896